MKNRTKGNKTGGFESPIFIPETPNSELKKILQKITNSTNIKIKIVERTGHSILSSLQKVTKLMNETSVKMKTF